MHTQEALAANDAIPSPAIPAYDSKGRLVAWWLKAAIDRTRTTQACADFAALALLQQLDGLVVRTGRHASSLIVLPVCWSTLRDSGAHYLHRLDHVHTGQSLLAVEVDLPATAYEASCLLAYQRELADRKVALGLRLPPVPGHGDCGRVRSLARASHATFVVASADAARTWPQQRGDQAGLGGAILVLDDVSAQADRQLADSIGACWRKGVAAQPAPMRVTRLAPMPASRRADGASLAGTSLAGMSLAIALAACSSVPQPAVPDGSSREPVNDPVRLAAITHASQAQMQVVAERSALYEQVGHLQQQVQALRNVVTLMLVEQAQAPKEPAKAEPSTSGATKPLESTGGSNSRQRVSEQRATLPEQSVETVAGGLVFRLFQDFGRAQFAPASVSQALDDALRQAARDATAIEVCGYTDSAIADDGNRRVAWARANEARRWLISQGVDANRIRTGYEPASHFLADERTEGGRAKNRRVELVFKGDMAQAAAIINRQQG